MKVFFILVPLKNDRGTYAPREDRMTEARMDTPRGRFCFTAQENSVANSPQRFAKAEKAGGSTTM
jgi:hypothetical protein